MAASSDSESVKDCSSSNRVGHCKQTFNRANGEGHGSPVGGPILWARERWRNSQHGVTYLASLKELLNHPVPYCQLL